MPAPRAVIFDAFGTLLESAPSGEELRQACLRRAHAACDGVVTLPPFAEFYETYVKERERDHAGASEPHKEFDFPKRLERAFLALKLGQRQARVLGARAAERYFQELSNAARLLDDAKGIVNRLPDGTRVALCSDFPSGSELKRALERLGLFYHFDHIAVSGDVGYRKPHPRVFQEALDGLGVDAQEAVMVGNDPERDVKGAKALGMKAVLVAYPRGSLPPARVPDADAVIGSLNELPLVLQKL